MTEYIKILSGQKEIAAYLGISVQTFWRIRDKMGIPYYRIGRRVLARTDALDKWAESLEEREEQLHDN